MRPMQRSAEEIKALDRRHVLHPNVVLADHARGLPMPIMVEGQGAVLRDIDGKEYIDAIGALWLANIGYGRKELAEVARRQMEKLSFWSLFWGYGNVPAVELAARLAEIAPPGLSHVFFTSGGSEANETSIKIARLYHVRRGEPSRRHIIGLARAYHGVSYGAMTATGLETVRQNYEPYVGAFDHIPSAYCYRCPLGKAYPACGVACAGELERKILDLGPQNVAAFIAEPIHGVGGVITPPPEYFPRIREICDRYGVLFIADEVICGFGRTGTWFGIEHWGVVPDLISAAKGLSSGYLPIGATLVHDRVYEALGQPEGPGAYFNHGFTYSGHPVAAAVALENIRILAEERLGERAVEMGRYLTERLRRAENPYIGDIRGKGLMLGVELVADPATGEMPADPNVGRYAEARCREHGVIVRALAPGNIIALSPPLVVTREQVDRIVEVLDEAVRYVFEHPPAPAR